LRVSLRFILLATFLAIVGLLVLGAALSVRGGLRADLLAVERQELERNLRVAQLALDGAELDVAAAVREVGRRTGARVTLVDRDGVVLGESEVSPSDVPRIENHRDRPEVRGALAGEVTFAQRRSGTIGVEILYGAVPVELEGRTLVLRLARPLDRMDAVVGGAWRDIRRAALLTVLLAVLAAYLLSRAVTVPLRNVSAGAQALGAGDFSTRTPRDSRILELDGLAQAFNRLAEELEDRVRELVRDRDEARAVVESVAEGVIALTEDARVLRVNRAAMHLLDVPRPLPFAPIGALVRQPELRDLLEASVLRPFDAREVAVGDRQLLVSGRMLERGAVITLLDVSELRRVERVRRDFVANASHELKTPLTAVRGFAEALLEEEPPEALRQQFLGSIRDNTLRLQHLVDDLLDLSRLESGAWSPEREALSVADVAKEVWEELPDEPKRRSIRFEVAGDAELEADRRALSQIFRNLFENAVRHTEEGGRVGVEIRDRGGRIRVAVSDDGSGIPSSALPRVFERFFRADPARDRGAGGSGLGLAIVRHLVSTMGGSVRAESVLGEGTTIRFAFPRDPSR
jgi:two-component system, OmpR family, phosphate regulon sensor histidine kinase PhoR